MTGQSQSDEASSGLLCVGKIAKKELPLLPLIVSRTEAMDCILGHIQALVRNLLRNGKSHNHCPHQVLRHYPPVHISKGNIFNELERTAGAVSLFQESVLNLSINFVQPVWRKSTAEL
jgi:hypothetical protein